jgi:hypothetical protein
MKLTDRLVAHFTMSRQLRRNSSDILNAFFHPFRGSFPVLTFACDALTDRLSCAYDTACLADLHIHLLQTGIKILITSFRLIGRVLHSFGYFYRVFICIWLTVF